MRKGRKGGRKKGRGETDLLSVLRGRLHLEPPDFFFTLRKGREGKGYG
jgi:hypothetical protein